MGYLESMDGFSIIDITSPHGTTGAYKGGCRCDMCREAHNEKQLSYLARYDRPRGRDHALHQAAARLGLTKYR